MLKNSLNQQIYYHVYRVQRHGRERTAVFQDRGVTVKRIGETLVREIHDELEKGDIQHVLSLISKSLMGEKNKLNLTSTPTYSYRGES
jgi:hypothetical protein